MRGGTPLILILAACLLSCARRAPLVYTLALDTSEAITHTEIPTARLVEARPDGLLITMQLPEDVPVAWSRAALLRQHQDDPVTLMHSISPDETQRQTLREQGITLLDRDLDPSHRYSYVTALYDAEDQLVWRGRAASLDWTTPPSAPERAEVTTLDDLGVRITWSARGQGWGVLILRRTLGERGSGMQRHAFVSSDEVDTHVDREVLAETGYVYRLAHARRVPQEGTSHTYMVLGQPGPEIYAVLPRGAMRR